MSEDERGTETSDGVVVGREIMYIHVHAWKYSSNKFKGVYSGTPLICILLARRKFLFQRLKST